jgi:hypothetical protein
LEDILEIPAAAAWPWQQSLYRWQTFAPDGDAPLRVMGFPSSAPPADTTMPSPRPSHPSCTALKWAEDGELSPLDLERILQLLSQADPVAQALLSAPLTKEGSSCR